MFNFSVRQRHGTSPLAGRGCRRSPRRRSGRWAPGVGSGADGAARDVADFDQVAVPRRESPLARPTAPPPVRSRTRRQQRANTNSPLPSLTSTRGNSCQPVHRFAAAGKGKFSERRKNFSAAKTAWRAALGAIGRRRRGMAAIPGERGRGGTPRGGGRSGRRNPHARRAPTGYSPDENGYFVGSAPTLPGYRTQARSIARSMDRMAEAIVVYLDARVDEPDALELVGVQRPAV